MKHARGELEFRSPTLLLAVVLRDRAGGGVRRSYELQHYIDDLRTGLAKVSETIRSANLAGMFQEIGRAAQAVQANFELMGTKR